MLKQDYDSPLKRFQEFQENGAPDDDTVTPDYDLPVDAWTNNQLISGVLESNRDNKRLANQRDALIEELECMKKTLQNNGLSLKIEMN